MGLIKVKYGSDYWDTTPPAPAQLVEYRWAVSVKKADGSPGLYVMKNGISYGVKDRAKTWKTNRGAVNFINTRKNPDIYVLVRIY